MKVITENDAVTEQDSNKQALNIVKESAKIVQFREGNMACQEE